MNVTLAPIFVFCRCSLASSIMHLHRPGGAVFLRRAAQIYNHWRSTTVTILGRHVITLTGSWVYFNRMLDIARCLPLANNYVVRMFLLVSSAHDLEILNYGVEI